MKKVTLRAFEIRNSDFIKADEGLCTLLKKKLSQFSSVDSRRMKLNLGDPQKEEDLISFFQNEFEGILFCTMVRISLVNKVQQISKSLFDKEFFSVADIKTKGLNADALYKGHYYFSLSDNYLVTDLPGNITIKRLQTYLNWLVQQSYDISPCIEKSMVKHLSEIKQIIVQDPLYPQIKQTSSSLKDLAVSQVKNFFNDTKSLHDIEISNMISAKLLIEFNKPQKQDNTAVRKAYSALLKPVSDLDNFVITTRDKKTDDKWERSAIE